MAIDRTEFFNLALPTLNHPLYNQALNDNFSVIDALLHRYIAVNNFEGPWQNSTAYTEDQTVADTDTGIVYICLIAHVSATDPTTFAQDRTAHPTYWDEYNSAAVDYAAQALESANDAADSAAAALISEANAAASAAAAATSGGDLRAVNNLSELTDFAVARANLGLLGMAEQNPGAVVITGGTVTGVPIADSAITGVRTVYDGGTAGGTVNALTCTCTPTLTSLVDKTIVIVRAAGANTSGTVTFAPDSLTAKSIRHLGNKTFNPAQIYGAGQDLILRYNLANDVWELLNPHQNAMWNGGNASGTDTITASCTPTPIAYRDGHRYWVRAAGANTTTTPTINFNSIGAKTITRLGNQALQIGDIFGANHELMLLYNSSTDKMELLNPAVAGWERIATGNVSATSSHTIANLSSEFRAYKIVFEQLAPATDAVSFYMRTDTNNGASFEAGASDYMWHFDGLIGAAGTYQVGGDDADTQIVIGRASSWGNTTNEFGSGEITIFAPMNSSVFTRISYELAHLNATPAYETSRGTGYRLAAEANNAILFFFSSGNIATMKYTLYGLRA